MDFSEVANQVFELYHRQDYLSAIDVVLDARESHPDRDHELTFFEACLLGRLEQPAEALSVLEAGMERGHWWPPGQLSDPDLDPVRDLPGWETLESKCAEITAEHISHRSKPIVRRGTGAGSVMALQGLHGWQEETAGIWGAAVPPEWTVITPAATEPSSSGMWSWSRSMEENVASIEGDLAGLDLRRPLVVSGISFGSAVACHLILEDDSVVVDRLIAVAPASMADFIDLRDAACRVPSLVICGDEDSRLPAYRDLAVDLEKVAPAEVHIIGGMGHEYPIDLDALVGDFLSRLGSAT